MAAISFFPCYANAVSADCAVLMDAETGRLLYTKNADKRSLIASTTKILTALIICEQCNVLDRMCIPKEAVGIEGSSMYLQEGEILTIQELLYGLMLHSGNDAAVALAIYCGGTVEGFTQLMNDKARQLNMQDSHFSNPHGLDAPDHYSTARDMAVLTAYAMKNPIFAKTVSTKSVRISNRSLRNHNKLLWQMEGVDGVKTGYTKAAGRILVSSATRQGRRLVAVTINDANDWKDHISLLEKGFSNYAVESVISAGEQLGWVEVLSGDISRIPVCTTNGFSYPLSQDETVQIIVQAPEFAYAPIAAGQIAGTAYILIDGTVVGKVPVCYAQTTEISREQPQPFYRRLLRGGGS